MKKVSIVLPTYNRAKVLTRAIDSVLAQTYQDWELIVVNDASTDETEELLRRYEAKDHRIRHITFEKNRGVVAEMPGSRILSLNGLLSRIVMMSGCQRNLSFKSALLRRRTRRIPMSLWMPSIVILNII